MQERLAELLRQRALVAEHLAWLDREIGRLASQATPPAAPSVATPAPVATPPSITADALAPATETPALALPEHRPADIKDDVKRGCFVYVAIAALLVVLGGGLLVWASQAYKRSHPPKPPAESSIAP